MAGTGAYARDLLIHASGFDSGNEFLDANRSTSVLCREM